MPVDNRRLDALVVEHITGGWFTTRKNGHYRWLCCYEMVREFSMIAANMDFPVGDSGSGAIPLYSTDPAASKQLRDKMREEGWIVLMGGPEPKVPTFWCQVRATYRKNTKGI